MKFTKMYQAADALKRVDETGHALKITQLEREADALREGLEKKMAEKAAAAGEKKGWFSFLKREVKGLDYRHPETLEKLEKELVDMGYSREMAISGRGTINAALGIVTSAAFLGAGVLMTLSSKEHKKDESESERTFARLCSVNAKLLAGFPPEMRDDMLHRITGYMRTRHDLTGSQFSAERFEVEVKSNLAHMSASPWLDKITLDRVSPANEYEMHGASVA